MKFRELVKQSYEDLKNLTVTWYNVIALTILVIVLSSFTTPMIGIPAGLLGSSYYLKRREEKGK
ncbi:TPA: peptide resistance ABC transporter activity modulator VraH [Staphylococcus aureus]|nr:peptide resistance ABC transporter activity modulator VraH [Staphylococcus aureus]HDA7598092.1 peptide resistance ABC transporter activity modulator VraH [Staphylococcus aureus]